jgi:hypothetical protein
MSARFKGTATNMQLEGYIAKSESPATVVAWYPRLIALGRKSIGGTPLGITLQRPSLITHPLSLLACGALALSLTATSVNALTINDTFLSTFQPTANTAGFEAAIQSASSSVASKFSNPATVNILFATSNSVLGQSNTAVSVNPYSAYTNLLQVNSAANPANTTLSTAVANLGFGNGGPGSWVASTTVNLRALGQSVSGFFDSSGAFVPGGGQQYDGVITLSPNLNFAGNGASVILHEINEILGGGGQGSAIGRDFSGFTGPVYGGLDLYRYQDSAPGLITSTPSFTTSPGALASFSVDGGQTIIADFNQAGGGSDYGDFGEVPCLIQSAFFCGTLDSYGPTSPEYLMMESLGYDPAATPLPSTWLMLLSGLVGFGFITRRGTKNRSSAFATA